MAKYKENLQKQETKKQFIPNKAHKQPKKRLKSSQVIVLILMIFWTLMSFLTAFLGIDRCNSKFNEVKADDVIENQNFTLSLSPFNASVRFVANFLSGSTSYILASNYDETLYNLNVSFNDGYITSANVNFNDFLFGDINSSGISSLLGQGTNEYYNINVNISNQSDRTLYVFNNLTSQLEAYSLIDGVRFKYSMQSVVTLNGIQSYISISMPNSMRITSTNFNRIDFFSSKTNIYTNVTQQSLMYHYMRYYNDLNQYIDVYYTVYDSRNITYNYIRYINSVQDLTNNEYYNLGYTTGYNESKNDIQREAYQDGYNNGLIDGEAQGFENGVESSNQYTFLSLFGAVIDAPLQALTGLFNFDLLGFNLLGLFQALITLCVIIFVVKLFV